MMIDAEAKGERREAEVVVSTTEGAAAVGNGGECLSIGAGRATTCTTRMGNLQTLGAGGNRTAAPHSDARFSYDSMLLVGPTARRRRSKGGDRKAGSKIRDDCGSARTRVLPATE